MRKNFLGLLIGSSLLLVVAGLTVAVRVTSWKVSTAHQQSSQTQTVSVFTVLEAHSGQDHKEWTRFTQQATLTYYATLSASSRRMLERRLTLSVDGSFVRYDKAKLNRSQSYRFDGHTLIQATLDGNTQVRAKVIDGVEAASIRFQMATFGLLPILKRLSEPGTDVVYLGPTSKGNQFQVKGVGGFWCFYVNSSQLIDRLEVNDLTITYGDYRTAEGLTLPFYQQVKKGDKLVYEIKLYPFDLNPAFAADFFKSDLS